MTRQSAQKGSVMAKLPENFVKPPPARSRLTTAKANPAKLGRRARKVEGPSDAPAEAHSEAQGDAQDSALATAADARSVLVRLSTDEHQALAAACAALASAGQPVSMEDMIKQVIARWMAATRAMQMPALPAQARAQAAQLGASHAVIRAQLRKLTEQPIRRWRELGQTLRRWSRSRFLA